MTGLNRREPTFHGTTGTRTNAAGIWRHGHPKANGRHSHCQETTHWTQGADEFGNFPPRPVSATKYDGLENGGRYHDNADESGIDTKHYYSAPIEGELQEVYMLASATG